MTTLKPSKARISRSMFFMLATAVVFAAGTVLTAFRGLEREADIRASGQKVGTYALFMRRNGVSSGDTMRTIFIIRHGEKPPDPNPGSTAATIGIDVDGNPNSSSLTPFGWQRAGALAGLFAPYESPARANVLTPAQMFSPNYPDDPPSGTISGHRT